MSSEEVSIDREFAEWAKAEALHQAFEARWARLNVPLLARMVGAKTPARQARFERELRPMLRRFSDGLHETNYGASKDLKNRLKRISNQASAFGAALDSIGTDAWEAMRYLAPNFEYSDPDSEVIPFGDLRWHEIRDAIRRLAEISDMTMQILPTKKGRKPNEALNLAVRDLGRLFEGFTVTPAKSGMSYDSESGKTTGSFLIFLSAILQDLAPEVDRSSSALAAILRRVTRE